MGGGCILIERASEQTSKGSLCRWTLSRRGSDSQQQQLRVRLRRRRRRCVSLQPLHAQNPVHLRGGRGRSIVCAKAVRQAAVFRGRRRWRRSKRVSGSDDGHGVARPWSERQRLKSGIGRERTYMYICIDRDREVFGDQKKEEKKKSDQRTLCSQSRV